MGINLEKDPALLAILARLERDLGATAFVVADDWEADLCAVGIASPANPRVVAYLSTWRQPPDRYHLELELPGESECRTDYRVAGRWDSIEYGELRDRIAQHLVSAGAR